MIYPNELLELLNEYLTDRVITRQERNVLLRKAQSLGVDPEEFDLYIQAQLQKLSAQHNVEKASMKGKTCPYCGQNLPELLDVCPYCDHHINPQGSQDLNELIANIEGALVNLKAGDDFERNKAIVESYLHQVNLLYANNPKVKFLTNRVAHEMFIAENRHREKERRHWVKNHIGWIVFAIIVFIGMIVGVVTDYGWGAFLMILTLGAFPSVIIGEAFHDKDDKK